MTHIIYITHITYITHIIYFTRIIYVTHILRSIFKAYKKTKKNIFYKFFLYIKMATKYCKKTQRKVPKRNT